MTDGIEMDARMTSRTGFWRRATATVKTSSAISAARSGRLGI
jgi:hypothetical protein